MASITEMDAKMMLPPWDRDEEAEIFYHRLFPGQVFIHQHQIIPGSRTCSTCGKTLAPKVPKRS